MSVTEVVPFLAVQDMAASLTFYVERLGFSVDSRWEVDGQVRWCRLQLGEAGLMLQQFETEGHDARRFADNTGEGVQLVFLCTDAVGFYRSVTRRGADATEPVVLNGLWATTLKDPDGYELLFESATEVPEETKLSDYEPGVSS